MSTLSQILTESKRIVFMGGAGVSTESGIPDFRSGDGLYSQASGASVPPEQVLSHGFFMDHPDEFFQFYREKILHPEAKPNPAHDALARLESQGKLSAIITQNIDGLHQMAGSRNVLELHGSVLSNTCMSCGQHYVLEHILESSGVPYCNSCGGIIKPDVVLYGEALDEAALRTAVAELEAADTLIVGGTSLTVYPAAGLIQYFEGDELILINKQPTPADALATLVLHEPIGEALGKAVLGYE
ncbi:MAG: NAD-dependent protein deacylase [Ancrocorticia sp.]|uniref:NAD-dependent protein deacylase n=1 Tax=Ancrocorticia sp. TaxID=2593684 RepID=UPI003F8E69BB